MGDVDPWLSRCLVVCCVFAVVCTSTSTIQETKRPAVTTAIPTTLENQLEGRDNATTSVLMVAEPTKTPEVMEDVQLDRLYLRATQKLVDTCRNSPAISPKFIILSFRDCIDATGCDGCFAGPLQDGVEKSLKFLDHLYEELQLAGYISFADLVALAGSVSLLYTSAVSYVSDDPNILSQTPPIEFKLGRKDCNSTPRVVDIPKHDSNGGWEEIESTMMIPLNLTKREATALMGAHTLGMAHRQPFASSWTNDYEIF